MADTVAVSLSLSYLSMIPNLTIAVPKDKNEFAAMLEFSAAYNSPLAIRYPRNGVHTFEKTTEIEVGKWEVLREGDGKVAILACGERAIRNLPVSAVWRCMSMAHVFLTLS